jgi:hypothetical protein
MKWSSCILTAAVALNLSSAAFAQSQLIERKFKGKSDHDINVGIFTAMKPDCTAGALPVVRLTRPPMHGKVTMKRGRLHATNFKQCLATELPAFVALYRSVPNFIGQDVLMIEVIGKNGKAQFQKITITVMKSGTDRGI